MNYFDVKVSGFLPTEEPMTNAIGWSHGIADKLNYIAEKLTHSAGEARVREMLVYELSKLEIRDLLELISRANDAQLHTLMRHFSYFASMYVFAPFEKPTRTFLPKEIAIPFSNLAKKVGRPPILSYASYCLTNWKTKSEYDIGSKLDSISFDAVNVDNIELIQNFTHDEAKRDEDWFILIHVDIEARAVPAIKAMASMCYNDPVPLDLVLEQIVQSLIGMNKTMRRMPEQCSADVYYNRVRPYIWSFENMIYEGVNYSPVTYRGETGAQSSIIPAFESFLGIRHSDSMLTTHLTDMRKYMPKEHRQFLTDLENPEFNLSNSVRTEAKAKSRTLYNDCVRLISEFRETHLQYAIDYIHKKVDNPTGTGGTPFIPWLSQLQKETEEFLL